MVTAAEYWLPSGSNGLPPPLPPGLSVCSPLAPDEEDVAGMLGARKICDEVELAAASLLSVEVALEPDDVESAEELVSMTRLVGTLPELAVAMLLTTEVADGSDVVESADDELEDALEEPSIDCRRSLAFSHRFSGPEPSRNLARMFWSSRPSSAQASLTSLVIESRPFTQDVLQNPWVKSLASQPDMLCS